jgi:hypothetical protein
MRVFQWRLAVRIDVRRAAFTFSGVTSALAVAIVFMTREPVDKYPRVGFGWELRTGTITMVPTVGDECRQNRFDNDSGAIWPADTVSCLEALGLAEKNARANSDVSHVMRISQTFRR